MKIGAHKNIVVVTLSLLAGLLAMSTQADADVYQGAPWVKKSKSVAGDWRVEYKEDGAYLVLADNFKTSNGPDLKLMLTMKSTAEVNGSNAAEGSLTISPLQSNKGMQSYKLPEGFANYTTLLIHCERFSKLWSATEFNLGSGATQ